MPVIVPPRTFIGRRNPNARRRAAGPLVLTAAAYDVMNAHVRLTFGRAVDIAGIVVADFTVDDQPNGIVYGGLGTATLVNPTTVQIPLAAKSMTTGANRLLTVTAANGIVADGDATAWVGCTNLAMPFP